MPQQINRLMIHLSLACWIKGESFAANSQSIGILGAKVMAAKLASYADYLCEMHPTPIDTNTVRDFVVLWSVHRWTRN